MKSSFLGLKETHTDEMKPVCELLDTKPGPYVFLYDDGGGTHVVEDCEGPGQLQELLTAALMVAGDASVREGRRKEFAAWLQRFIDAYGES